MSNYLKLFEKTNEYNQYIEGDSFLLPNVSHTEDTLKVYYNPIPPHDYSKDYFTIVVTEGDHIGFNPDYTDDGVVFISKDKGETWDEVGTEGIDVFEGDNILVKCMINAPYNGKNFITTTDNTFKAKIQGNIMSLLLGENFMDATVLENANLSYLFGQNYWLIDAQNLVLPAEKLVESCYSYMFSGCSNLVYAPELPATTLANSCYNGMFSYCLNLVYAPKILPATTLANADNCYYQMFRGCSNLVYAPELPATTLAEGCYKWMFANCSNLVYAPKVLPATTLANYCYNSMFSDCSSLVTAPELPAKTLAEGCYQDMFSGCSNLVYAPELPATTLANSCYNGMFGYCLNLVYAPELPATTLANADNCYYQMFRGCSNLVYAPELPATTLAEGCYKWMFANCSNLVYAPKILPATTLAQGCYAAMFYGCTSLVTAPELPAMTLANADNCYQDMFSRCASLNYVKAMFTTAISNQQPTYTSAWLSNVSATGTFVGNAEASWLDNVTRGNSTVPEGWTIEKE